MYAVRDLDAIVPEDGGAPVYEGLRVVRPRAGAPDQQDFLEFGQIVSGDEGEQIGLRAAGSPGWQLVRYTGTLNGSPITAEQLPREGGPMWPEDDELRTAAAIEQKLEEVFRYGKFESMRWRGASDAWLEKWWPRFEGRIAEGLAASYRDEQAPVVDAEGLAIASGTEIRGATILPPTRAGWQRFLELSPRSGENFTTLKEIGLDWWGRKIPQNLLSREEKEQDAAEAPAASGGSRRSRQRSAQDAPAGRGTRAGRGPTACGPGRRQGAHAPPAAHAAGRSGGQHPLPLARRHARRHRDRDHVSRRHVRRRRADDDPDRGAAPGRRDRSEG